MASLVAPFYLLEMGISQRLATRTSLTSKGGQAAMTSRTGRDLRGCYALIVQHSKSSREYSGNGLGVPALLLVVYILDHWRNVPEGIRRVVVKAYGSVQTRRTRKNEACFPWSGSISIHFGDRGVSARKSCLGEWQASTSWGAVGTAWWLTWRVVPLRAWPRTGLWRPMSGLRQCGVNGQLGLYFKFSTVFIRMRNSITCINNQSSSSKIIGLCSHGDVMHCT